MVIRPQIAPPRLSEASFIYAGGRIPVLETKRLGERTDGLVLRKKGGYQAAISLRRQLGYAGALVFDPSRYEDDWAPSHDTIWREIERQAAVGVAAFLSPSPFIQPGDVRSLRKVLEQGEDFAAAVRQSGFDSPALTVLPLTKYWLTAGISNLLAEVESASQPLAIVLGDRNDPLGSARAVKGFLQLLASSARLSLLRSDLAAIGGLAHGAWMVAMGTGTSVRHFVPPGQTGGGVSNDPTPSVLVRILAAYYKGSKLEQVKGLDKGMLDCQCAICDGQSLTRFRDVRFAPQAALHNAEVAYGMARHIVNLREDLRPKSWSLTCSEAVEAHKELEGNSRVPFEPSPQLKAWANPE